MTAPTPNTAELVAIYQHIKANPQEWDQAAWAVKTTCGTTYCFAGHAVVRAGLPLRWTQHAKIPTEQFASHLAGGFVAVPDRATELLGLNDDQADQLFYTLEDLDDIREYIRELTGVDPELVTS